jgi:peptidoglycan hydrolase CwlO-like protein
MSQAILKADMKFRHPGAIELQASFVPGSGAEAAAIKEIAAKLSDPNEHLMGYQVYFNEQSQTLELKVAITTDAHLQHLAGEETNAALVEKEKAHAIELATVQAQLAQAVADAAGYKAQLETLSTPAPETVASATAESAAWPTAPAATVGSDAPAATGTQPVQKFGDGSDDDPGTVQ